MAERVRTVVKPKVATTRVRTTVKLPPKPKRVRYDLTPPPVTTTPAERRGRGGTKGKGTRSNRTRLTLEALRQIDESFKGQYPHQIMLEVCNTGRLPGGKKRLKDNLFVQVLAAAAPYFAPRMAAVHLKNDPPFLNGDLTRLQNMDPEKIAIANEVLGRLYGGDYKDKPILDLTRIGVSRDDDTGEATGNVYGDTLAAETEGDDE